ncbi:MAG: folate-binding protein [Casimicrobiaceae bacterium]
MNAPIPFDPLPAGAFCARLSQLAAIDVDGADARGFLHGQLSSDVKALAVGDAQYASYNSPKGRMLATLVVWRRSESKFCLLLAADLATVIARRLTMFVMRAQVLLAPSARPLYGVMGNGAGDAIARLVPAAVGVGLGVADVTRTHGWTSVQAGDRDLLQFPDGRWLLDGGDPPASDVTMLAPADESLWQWCAIRAGVPWITAATSDKLVAQSANWELVGGVDFRKGCYPGQEIIARMQYLGRLKERLYALHAPAPANTLPPGTSISIAGHEQAAGIVVNAASTPSGGSDLLAVLNIDTADAAAPLAAGVSLATRALPYAVPAIANVRVKL